MSNLKVKLEVEYYNVVFESVGVNSLKTDGRIERTNVKVKLEVEYYVVMFETVVLKSQQTDGRIRSGECSYMKSTWSGAVATSSSSPPLSTPCPVW